MSINLSVSCLPSPVSCLLFPVSFFLLLLFLPGCGNAPPTPGYTATLYKEPDLLSETEGELIGETWDVHRLGEAKIGHRWTREYRMPGRVPRIRRLTIDQLTIPRFGSVVDESLRMTTLRVEHGKLTQLAYRVTTGQDTRQVECRVIDGARLQMYERQGNRRNTKSIPWNDQTRGYFGVEESLQDSPLQPGAQRTIQALVPITDKVVSLNMTAHQRELVELPDGPRELLRITVTAGQAADPFDVTTYWADEQGQVVKIARSFLNHTTYRASEMVAMMPNDALSFDVAIFAMVPLAQPFPDASSATYAKFRVTLTDGNPADVIPSCSYQRVTPIDARTAEVEVWSEPNLEIARRQSAADRPVSDDVEPNRWLQCTDTRVRAFAAAAAESTTDTRFLAEALRLHVFRTVKTTDFGQVLLTAAEVAQQREGDCTESAMLLAAACRARGLPARVVIGLIYDEQREGFVYHMWNEIWTADRWIPADATLAEPRLDAIHLKLSDNSLASDSDYPIVAPVLRLAGQLDIELVESK